MTASRNFNYLPYLIFLSIVTYLNTVIMDFVWDDFQQIVYNPLFDDLKFSFTRIFTEPLNINFPVYFRPIFSYSIALDVFFWGKQMPSGFHLSNIIMHTLVVIFIFIILQKLEINRVSVFIIAMIFAVHPIHCEVVALISARNELLSSIFMLLSFYVYISDIKTKYLRVAVSAALFLFALFSKENAIFFPFLILLYEYLYRKGSFKTILKVGLPYLLVFIFYLSLRVMFIQMPFGFNDPLKERIFTFMVVLPHYIKTVFYPFQLKVFYDVAPAHSLNIQSGILFAVLSLSFLMLLMLKKDKRVTFFVFWFLIILMPASNLLSLLRPSVVADRYNYLPSLGLIVLFVLLLERLLKTSYEKVSFTFKIFYLFIILLFSFTTIRDNWKWENYITFAKEMVKDAPNNAFTYNNLGISFSLAKKYSEAEDAFKMAISLDKQHTGALYGLGRIYLEQGRYEEAVEAYKKVVLLKPDFVDAHYYLGQTYFKMNRLKEAEDEFLVTIHLYPKYDLGYSALGEIYMLKGNYQKAAAFFESALRSAPWVKEYEIKFAEMMKNKQGN